MYDQDSAREQRWARLFGRGFILVMGLICAFGLVVSVRDAVAADGLLGALDKQWTERPVLTLVTGVLVIGAILKQVWRRAKT